MTLSLYKADLLQGRRLVGYLVARGVADLQEEFKARDITTFGNETTTVQVISVDERSAVNQELRRVSRFMNCIRVDRTMTTGHQTQMAHEIYEAPVIGQEDVDLPPSNAPRQNPVRDMMVEIRAMPGPG